MKKLLICITMCFLLGLTACSNNEETKPNDDSKLSLEESSYYIDIENGMSSLDGAFALNEDETLEIDGDYDLTKAGKYEVKIVVTNKAGEKTEHNKTIIVDTKEKLDEIKNEEISNKPSEPSVDVEQPEETKEPEKEEVKVEPKPTPTTKPEEKPTLDTSDWRIALAYDYEGKAGTCDQIAYQYMSEIFPEMPNSIVNYTEVSAKDAQIGDKVVYTSTNGGVGHQAVYLGNGMALHGNYNGKTQVGSVYGLPNLSEPSFGRPTFTPKETPAPEPTESIQEFNIDMCYIKATDHMPGYPEDITPDDLLYYCYCNAPKRVDWSE